MITKDWVVVTGVLDPEMLAIRTMLSNMGYMRSRATFKGKSCSTGTAMITNGFESEFDASRPIVWVECLGASYKPGIDLIVDHHNEGDPGYNAPPEEFWLGSSIGQVTELVGGSYMRNKYIAAGDHCLAAAMRSECPGIKPMDLMAARVRIRAAMARIPEYELRKRIVAAGHVLDSLPTIRLDGVDVIDATTVKQAELRDAAAWARKPILLSKTRYRQTKICLYGAPPEVTQNWLVKMGSASFVTRSYGSPSREYAGLVLNREMSDILYRSKKHVDAYRQPPKHSSFVSI